MATVPDLPGCMSDGEMSGEAVARMERAAADWIAEARRLGRTAPKPVHHAA